MRIIGITLLMSVAIFSCKSTNNTSTNNSSNGDIVIGSVGDQDILYSELMANISSGTIDTLKLSDVEDFLPTYLNYRAKIQFAEDQGIMADPELVSELELYGKQASYSYWLENRIKETEFEKYYNRASTEIKSEHLLIAVSPDASPEDTLEAYNKLIEARNKFLNGSTIEELNPDYSSVQNGRSMGGDLPWFSIGTTVKEFEDVIYSLKIGEISMPFRTQFGYHIVHLQDKRERTLSRNVSHIFKRAGNPDALEEIKKAYSSLNEGKNWTEVALLLSDDQLSASNGGNIGWINYGRYNTAFVDSIMKIDPKIDFTEPIRTIYGYHIFRIDSVQTFSNDEERKASYMQEFLDSPNYKKSNSFVIDWFRKEFDESINKKSLNNLEDYLKTSDTLRIDNLSSPDNGSTNVYNFKKYSFSIQDYFTYLKDAHGQASANSYNKSWFNDFTTYAIDSKIIEMTMEQFPEFETTLDNYKKGLAVYQVNDTYLWSASTVDSTKLKEIYKENPKKYSFPKRYYYHMLSALTDTTLDKGIGFIDAGNSPDSVRTYFPKVAVNRDSTGVFTDSPYDRLETMAPGTFSERFEYRRRKAIFYLNEVLPARQMTFDESFNRLLADYQPEREQEWLNWLQKEYNVKTYPSNLREAYNKNN